MKKIFLLGMLLGIISFSLKAQQEIDYTTFFHEGVRWTSGEYDVDNHIIRSDEYYEIKGDSVIGEYQYNKLIWNGTLIALIRNDAGNIYFRLLKDENSLPIELWDVGHWGTLHKDYLLYTFTNQWNVGTPLTYTYYVNRFAEPFKDTIQEEYLSTIQLNNGKSYKRYREDKYRDMIYGFGHYLRGPLGFLIYERAWEGGHCLVELYDHDELIYRTTHYTFDDITNTSADPTISVFYSPYEKSLHVDTTLPEESYTVDVFNTDGFKILSFSGISRTLENFTPGIYPVRIREGANCIYESKIKIE